LATEEIPAVVRGYRRAVESSIATGFDGMD
jgi:hypothetical protein